MTKQEFTERTGINPTEEEFDKIHDLYILTGAQMDKDSFCAAYMSCKDMTLINALYNSLLFSTSRLKEERDSIEKERKEDRKKLEDLWDKTDEAVFKILDMSEDAPDEDHAILNSIAVSLVGKFDVCMAKLDRGYVMHAEEREYFYDEIANLRNKCGDLEKEVKNR